MNKSPAWRNSRRALVRAEIRAKATGPDLSKTPANAAVHGSEQMAKYLHGTLLEYFKIRSGPSGYQRFIDAALKPPPQIESIDETLARLSGEHPAAREPRLNTRRS